MPINEPYPSHAEVKEATSLLSLYTNERLLTLMLGDVITNFEINAYRTETENGIS